MPKKTSSKPAKTSKRVLVIDDHPVFRAGLIGVVEQEEGLIVCGEAADAAQALRAIDRLQPDLVLMDMSLPDQDGLALLQEIRSRHPQVLVLAISMHDETLYAQRVLHAGGRGYLMKKEGPDRIIHAIRKVLSGQIYVSERIAALILDHISGARAKHSSPPMANLTDREFEVLRLIGHGREPRAIAQQLGISIKTIDTHRSHLRAKLKLQNATELIHYATRWLSAQQAGRSGA